MVEMTCEEHDRQAASTQFITHTVGLGGAVEFALLTRGLVARLDCVVSECPCPGIFICYSCVLFICYSGVRLHRCLGCNLLPQPPPTRQVGRILGAMDVSSTDINTRGFDALLNLVENTSHDSFDLYYGLFLYNANATGAPRAPR